MLNFLIYGFVHSLDVMQRIFLAMYSKGEMDLRSTIETLPPRFLEAELIFFGLLARSFPAVYGKLMAVLQVMYRTKFTTDPQA